MVQSHLLEYGLLNYDVFINDFIKMIVSGGPIVRRSINNCFFILNLLGH